MKICIKKLIRFYLPLMGAISLIAASCTPQSVQPNSTISAAQSVGDASTNEVTETGSATESAESKVGGTLVFSMSGDPDTLDMQKTNMSLAATIMAPVTCTLISRDTAGNYIPYAAESWETSADGLNLTFHLRHDVKFHNGAPVTAADWVYTIERSKSPDITSVNSTFAKIASAEAIDDYTLLLHLDEPYYPLFYSLSSDAYAGVISKKFAEEQGDKYGLSTGSVTGCGPYQFVEWQLDDYILLKRNPDYTWGPVYYEGVNTGPYYIDQLEYKNIPEYATTLAALETGEIDSAGIEFKDVEQINTTENYNIEKRLAPSIVYLELNNSKPPFDNNHIRRAFSYALNRDIIVNVVMSGEAVKTLSMLTPAMVGYWPDIEKAAIDYNREKALEEFSLAGYTTNADGLLEKDGEPFKITLWIFQEPMLSKTAEVVAAQLKDIGITVDMQQREINTLIGEMLQGNYEIAIMGYGYGEADLLYLLYHSSSGFWNFVKDSALDQMLDLTHTEIDPAKRQKAVDDVLTYLSEQSYSIPLFAPISYETMTNKLTNYQYTDLQGFILADAYLTDLP